MKPMFEFRQHGQCGRWVSSVLPHTAECVDDLAFLMAMTSRTNVHGPGSYLMNTGFLLPGFPCIGAWVSYALGRLTDNLPTFVVLPDARDCLTTRRAISAPAFCRSTHQGTIINARAPSRFRFCARRNAAKYITPDAERDGLALAAKAQSRARWRRIAADSRLEARIASYELAAKMQLSAPEVFDLTGESEATRKLYGLDNAATDDFGRRCLLARRLIERGVRFVQVWSGAGGPTAIGTITAASCKELPPMAAATDQPIAALLHDLKARGLLEDTLVLWSTEFGRMPFTQGSDGRDHNGGTFVRLDGRRRRAAAASRTARVTSGRGAARRMPSPPTTFTPPCCTCSASITNSSPSAQWREPPADRRARTRRARGPRLNQSAIRWRR